MKKILIFLCAVTLVFGIVATASAISFTYKDTYKFGQFMKKGDRVKWEHDITDTGFNPTTQDVTSAEITLWLKDDGLDMKERARLKLGINKFSWEVDNGKVSFTLESLITLSDTGKIIAILIAKKGDFYFGQASLFATATDPSPIVPQPEPATILLMGSGILGLVIYGRKRYIKKA